MSVRVARSSVHRQVRVAHERWREAWVKGPERLRWSQLPVQVGDRAPEARLADSAGHSTTLSAFWTERPILFVFLRHFGCNCTGRRIARLTEDAATLSELQAGIVLIGQGEPARARAFSEERGIAQPLLCDPQREVYHAYGLLDGMKAQIVYGAPSLLVADPRPGLEMADTMKGEGRWLVDSPWQLGGEVLVDRAGVIRLVNRYRHCDDFSNPVVIAATLAEMAAEDAQQARQLAPTLSPLSA